MKNLELNLNEQDNQQAHENTVHPTLKLRKIIHIDMDCFYAAVEQRDQPELKGKPVVVGGPPHSRSVVCASSYEARKFGVYSAMSSYEAYRRCPQAHIIMPNFEKYRKASEQIHEIFKKYTDLIEPLSLDEAYLDVSEHNLYATKIAALIRAEIKNKLQLTASAGIAPNKLIAKIASDFNKPNGQTVVLPQQVLSFMANLKLRKIPGVGPVTEKKLEEFSYTLNSDIWKSSLPLLCKQLGERSANWLYYSSRGIDTRPVKNSRLRKSIGMETTFSKDLYEYDTIEKEILKLSNYLSEKLRKKNLKGKTITLKIKYPDFSQVTRCRSLESYTDNPKSIYTTLILLLDKVYDDKKPIRLLGACLSKLQS